jgi:hypothetical protein
MSRCGGTHVLISSHSRALKATALPTIGRSIAAMSLTLSRPGGLRPPGANLETM